MEEEDAVTPNLCLKSTSGAMAKLEHGLAGMAVYGRPGSADYDVLRGALAAAAQEASLRLVSLTHVERQRIVECRQALLDVAAGVAEPATAADALFNADKGVAAACRSALAAAETQSRAAVAAAAGPALEALNMLERGGGGGRAILLGVRSFAARLQTFLEIAAARAADLISPAARGRAAAAAGALRRLLPTLVHSLQDSAKRGTPVGSAPSAFFFGLARDAVRELVVAVDADGASGDAEDDDDETGLFVRHLDAALEVCETPEGVTNVIDLGRGVEWIVRFSLCVAKMSSSADDSETLADDCRAVLRGVEDVRAQPTVAAPALRSALETLEANLNRALLRLILELFCQAHSPLDELIHSVLNADVSPPDRRPEDLECAAGVAEDYMDALLRLAAAAPYCTDDRKRVTEATAAATLARGLEPELVPACLRLYFNPDDSSAKAQVRSLRSLWLQEVECLERNILGIVDSAAICHVIHDECKAVAAEIRREQYIQDRVWLHRQGSRLVRMCQRAVDFAWKEVTKDGNGTEAAGLADDHPIVKVERSTWEVQGALRMVLAAVEDLNAHKTMIRRVQVLVTCVGHLAQYLASKSETLLSGSQVKVLTSVTRITIGRDSRMTVVTEPNPISQRKVSRAKSMSFRSVTVDGQKLTSRSAERSVAVEADMARLAREADLSIMPQRARATNGSIRPSTSKSAAGGTAFDFTEIFDELSALSREVTRGLADDDANQEAQVAQPAMLSMSNMPHNGKGNTSLRQAAMLNSMKPQPMAAAASSSSKSPSPSSPMLLVRTPERLRDIRTLDAKLAAIKSDLEGKS